MGDLELFMFGLGVLVTASIGGLVSGYVWFERVYEEDRADESTEEAEGRIAHVHG
jgi:hypothetical protein